jgi:hypothetical protein
VNNLPPCVGRYVRGFDKHCIAEAFDLGKIPEGARQLAEKGLRGRMEGHAAMDTGIASNKEFASCRKHSNRFESLESKSCL